MRLFTDVEILDYRQLPRLFDIGSRILLLGNVTWLSFVVLIDAVAAVLVVVEQQSKGGGILHNDAASGLLLVDVQRLLLDDGPVQLDDVVRLLVPDRTQNGRLSPVLFLLHRFQKPSVRVASPVLTAIKISTSGTAQRFRTRRFDRFVANFPVQFDRGRMKPLQIKFSSINFSKILFLLLTRRLNLFELQLALRGVVPRHQG